jgi:Ca-activated chloride channel homolog
VVTLGQVLVAIRGTLAEWRRLPWDQLRFSEVRTAILVVTVLLAITILLLLARRVRSPIASRAHVVLPALLPTMRRSYASAVRHAPFFVFLLGVPFFAVALADPHTAFTREEVTYPGRRIALLVDASTSMALRFESTKLHPQGPPAFFTAVAAAEHFIRLRMKGPYRDLVALIEFGNQAYVVTPFTTDYENILLSTKLVSDPREWGRFNDWGTTIVQGIDVGARLFESFDFLNASGNLMVVFTDGRDDQTTLTGRRFDDLFEQARRYGIPVYMIRIASNMPLGKIAQDALWKAAIERTGGRFYAAPDEDSLLRAEDDIDRLSPGRVDLHVYTSEQPRFAGFALIAVALWTFAGALKLGFRRFRTFP